MCVMALNQNLNGVELYFDGKPGSSILDGLKAVGYRWHNIKKCWYAKQNSQTLELAKMLADEEPKQGQPEQITITPTIPTQPEAEQPKLIYPDLETIGFAKISIDSSISILSGLGPTCKTGYFADINAYISIKDRGINITDLTNALSTGKECKTISICFDWSLVNDMGASCYIFNRGVKTFKEVYDRYFIGTETDGGERYEGHEKGIETFTPFKRIPPIKTPSKWTIAHVWKAILSGQIYTGQVDGHYSDDYAYDNAVNFRRGAGLELIGFAAKLIDSKSGWGVSVTKQDGGKAVLSVNCYSFDCNTMYYDESCTIEDGKRRRDHVKQEKEQHNSNLLAQVINLEPDQLSKANIYTVRHLVMDDNTGKYEVHNDQLQWHDIFWTETNWEGENETEVTECRLKVVEYSKIDINPRVIYQISNTFDRYNGDDERVIQSSCYICYVTGYALREMLQDGARIPMISKQVETFEHLEKDLRMYYQPVHERGFTCSKSTLFGVGSPASFEEEHRKLMKEWNRIPM